VEFLARILRYTWTTAWYLFAATVVLLAAVFGAARLLLPYADQYGTELSARLSDYLGQVVLIGSLDAEWHGLGPSLVLNSVDLLDPTNEYSALTLSKVRLHFNLLASVVDWRPVFSQITLVGAKLELARGADGHMAVAGLAREGGGEEDVGAFSEWLFSQGRVSLEDSDITWRDETGKGRVLHFTDIHVTLRNHGQRHWLDASVQMPRSTGRALRFAVDMEGNPLSAEGRRTRAYFFGEQVDLAELFGEQWLGDVRVAAKNADFAVWSEWRGGRLQMLQGKVDTRAIRFTAGQPAATAPAPDPAAAVAPTMAIDRLGGVFRWQREATGWRLAGKDIVLLREGKPWRPASLSLAYAKGGEKPPTLQADMSFLRLEDVGRLLDLFQVGGSDLQHALQALAPHGEIRDAHLQWRGGVTAQYQAYARFAGFGVNAWRAVPEARAMNGQLWLDEGGGLVALRSAQGELDFPALFRWPIPVTNLSGQVGWRMGADGWRVVGRHLLAGNGDIRAKASLDVAGSAAGASPFMSLVVDFQDGDASQVARYLPVGVMSKKSVEWLDNAIIGARIVSGGALFHGRLKAFPFDGGDGRFEVRFHVNDGALDYAPGWPRIEAIGGDVLFQGRALSVRAEGGRILQSTLQGVTVSIPDMTAKPLLLSVKGEVQGATQDKLDYLVASPPLNKTIGKHLAMLNAGGDSLLHLDLLLPIGASDETQVRGSVELQDNTLAVPPLGMVLDRLNGTLHFTQDGLEAEDVQAALLGQPARIDIHSDDTEQRRQIRVTAQGRVNAPELAARYLPTIAHMVEGESDLQVALTIPLGQQQAPTKATVLRVKSSLQGVAAHLPAPFAKVASEKTPLQLRMDFPAERLPLLFVDYGGSVSAVCEINDKSPTKVQRGEVRLGGGAVKLPAEDGLQIVGWLDRFSLDDWRPVITAMENGAGREETPWLRSADVAARVVEAFGQTLHNFQLKLQADVAQWLLDVQSEEVVGKIRLPRNDEAVEATMQRLYLAKPEAEGGPLDPRDLPALKVNAEDVRFQDRQLGSLTLETTKIANGLRLEQLQVKPQATTINAVGGWYVEGDKQHSNIDMQVKSSRLDRTLKSMGYVGGIDGGKGELDLKLEWPGSFLDVDPARIRGEMHLDLRHGQLLDIDPGAGGRIFGMLSLQTLPRRLFLDFSDVFKKGFGFDVIKGNFTVEDGNAYTNDLTMDGPAARVEVAGRVGLAQQDYDQRVTVTPHVGDSLPVIGALAAAPQVGAAILFVQKLFEPQIDRASRNQYTITGPWDAPVIKKLKSSAAQKNDKTDK
jgi:uncharacterized protein (TIGR02099 family)